MFRRILTATTVLLTPALAYAVTPIPGTPVTITKLKGLVEEIATTFLEIAAVIVVIFIVYGGIKMVSSAGDTTKFGDGKKIIINALIGGAVIFGVGVIVNTIGNFARNPTTINGGGQLP